jgi:transcriptional regulator with XRE-family HTH domain
MRNPEVAQRAWLQAFGAHLRAVRIQAGLSQRAVAASAGVHAQSWRRWEQGLRAPKPWRIAPIARALGVPAASLLENDPAGARCVAEVWVSRETLLEIRREGRGRALEVAERIARQLEPELWHAATGRLPRAHDVPARAKPRRTRAEVLAGVQAATEAATRARLRAHEAELERIEAERLDGDGAAS